MQCCHSISHNDILWYTQPRKERKKVRGWEKKEKRKKKKNRVLVMWRLRRVIKVTPRSPVCLSHLPTWSPRASTCQTTNNSPRCIYHCPIQTQSGFEAQEGGSITITTTSVLRSNFRDGPHNLNFPETRISFSSRLSHMYCVVADLYEYLIPLWWRKPLVIDKQRTLRFPL